MGLKRRLREAEKKAGQPDGKRFILVYWLNGPLCASFIEADSLEEAKAILLTHYPDAKDVGGSQCIK